MLGGSPPPGSERSREARDGKGDEEAICCKSAGGGMMRAEFPACSEIGSEGRYDAIVGVVGACAS